MCGDHTDPLRPRPLPARAADVTPSPHAVKNQTERLKWLGGRGFDDVKIKVEQACFRPESRRGKPVIGELVEGVYIASGHSVWGICNGPGTGKCMVRKSYSLFNGGWVADYVCRQNSSWTARPLQQISVHLHHELKLAIYALDCLKILVGLESFKVGATGVFGLSIWATRLPNSSQ